MSNDSETYAVIQYDDQDRGLKANYFEIKHITTDLNYAKKLAFHYAKNDMPRGYYGRYEYRIAEDYYGLGRVCCGNEIIIEYRIFQVNYDDEKDTYGFDSLYSGHVWSVIKFKNDVPENVEEIDNDLIYNDSY